jgi:hypothetical protein
MTKVFDQYLRATMVPTFEYRIAGDTLSYGHNMRSVVTSPP